MWKLSRYHTPAACMDSFGVQGSLMAIDDSGDWRTGSEASDIELYLTEYTASEEAYPATAFHPIACPCGSDQFQLVRAGSITRQSCSGCGQVRIICRDGDPIHWEEAIGEENPEPYACVACHGDAANVYLGFAGYAEKPDLDAVKWFYVGVRCCGCGVLGCFNSGKVGRGPMAAEIFRQVAGESWVKGE
jgi:hypothetical protein